MSLDKVTYDQMIDMLKSSMHKAPEIWLDIENELAITDELGNLKLHSAPTELWVQIENELDDVMPSRQITNKGLNKIAFAVAAMVTVLIAGYLYIGRKAQSDFVYKSEIEIIKEELPEIELSVDAYAQGISFIKDNSNLYSEENIVSFKLQLEEINTAIEKINTIQEQYGSDESILKMLSRLERKKAELIKSMINRP